MVKEVIDVKLILARTIPTLSLQPQIRKIMKKKNIDFTQQKPLNLDGFITIQKKDDGLHTADFQCCEDVQMEPFKGDFRVQGMRDGNIYMDQKPKRKKNKPIFRQDNSSLSLGKDDVYYFIFRLPKDQLRAIPEKLVKQVNEVVMKIVTELF